MTESRFRASKSVSSWAYTACAAFLTTSLTAGLAQAADHADSPSLNTEASVTNPNPAAPEVKQADINDIYAFMNPGDDTELILIMTIAPDASPTETFSQSISYNFLIENDTNTHLRIQCTFPTVEQVSCTLGDLVVAGAVGGDVLGEGMRVYTGLRDDPFFFNGMGLNQTFAAFEAGESAPDAIKFSDAQQANGGEANNFAGENILALVIGVNRNLLIASETQGGLKLWAATESM
jgi:hypothetical protein